VKLVGKNAKKYRIRTRDGYRILRQAPTGAEDVTASGQNAPNQ
jgi:hypothetical protein